METSLFSTLGSGSLGLLLLMLLLLLLLLFAIPNANDHSPDIEWGPGFHNFSPYFAIVWHFLPITG